MTVSPIPNQMVKIDTDILISDHPPLAPDLGRPGFVIEDMHSIYLIHPPCVFQHSLGRKHIEGSYLAQLVLFGEFSDGQILPSPRVGGVVSNIVKV
jgi:hypothetical protein